MIKHNLVPGLQDGPLLGHSQCLLLPPQILPRPRPQAQPRGQSHPHLRHPISPRLKPLQVRAALSTGRKEYMAVLGTTYTEAHIAWAGGK